MIIISSLIAPELVLLIAASIALIGHCFIAKQIKCFAYVVCQLGLWLAVLLLLFYDRQLSVGHQFYWQHQFILDHLAVVLKSFILILASLVLHYSYSYVNRNQLQSGEYYALITYSTLGMLLLVSAHNLLLIYMSLELMSLPIYTLIAIKRKEQLHSEAAVKYFIMGALSSGLILYGMSFIYGITRELDIAKIAQQVIIIHDHYSLVLLGMGCILILVGMAFKLGLVPFHMWLPDVYQGAPMSVVLLMAVLPKLAILAMFLRILVTGVPIFSSHWHQCILIIGLLSIILGNVAAIVQSNIKRLFGYSTIAHMGFVALGLYVATNASLSAALFYGVSYAFMGLAGFAMLLLLSKQGFDLQHINDLKGLNNNYPGYSFLFLLIILSMIGLPPLVGFYAKLFILTSLVNTGNIYDVYVATTAILFSVVGAYYYLRIIKNIYFVKADNNLTITTTPGFSVVFCFNSLLLLVLGIMPSWLMMLFQFKLI